MLDVRKLAETRRAELEKRQRDAIGRWKPYIEIVETFFKEQGRELHEYQKANIAQCCDNLFDFYVLNKMGGMISETTTSDAIAFARQMLPTIPALLPSLVADHVSIVQAIDRPQAQVYYMNIKAATTKGAVGAASSLISATGGHASSDDARGYASDQIFNEATTVNSGAYGSASVVYNAMKFYPMILGSVRVRNITIKKTAGGAKTVCDMVDAGLGTNTLVAVVAATGVAYGVGTGTYAIDTGIVTLAAGGSDTFEADTTVTMNYRYNVETCTHIDRIGGLDIEVTSANVDAMVFPLKLNYTVFSAINLQKIHGLVLADEGMKFATQEIRFAIDQVVLNYVLAAANSTGAATTVGDFSCTVGATQEWIWRIHEFKRYISKASANIFAKTLRATGNVIVGGINVCSLIEQLPEFKPAAGLGTKPPAGPYVAGTLGSRLVICNPFWNANQYTVLFRGDNYLFAGLIYAPYVPLYATDPVTLADLTTQRGFLSQAAVKRINDGMFCYGSISGY